MDSKCRDCGAEVLWAQAGTARIPLDARVPVYRITSTLGMPSAEKASSTLGMPFVAMVDHRRVCDKHLVAVCGPPGTKAHPATTNYPEEE